MWAVLRFRTAFVVVCASMILAVTSCSQTPRQRYQQRLAETGEPALHAVYSERLVEVMGDLNRITLERLPQVDHVVRHAEPIADRARVVRRLDGASRRDRPQRWCRRLRDPGLAERK